VGRGSPYSPFLCGTCVLCACLQRGCEHTTTRAPRCGACASQLGSRCNCCPASPRVVCVCTLVSSEACHSVCSSAAHLIDGVAENQCCAEGGRGTPCLLYSCAARHSLSSASIGFTCVVVTCLQAPAGGGVARTSSHRLTPFHARCHCARLGRGALAFAHSVVPHPFTPPKSCETCLSVCHHHHEWSALRAVIQDVTHYKTPSTTPAVPAHTFTGGNRSHHPPKTCSGQPPAASTHSCTKTRAARAPAAGRWEAACRAHTSSVSSGVSAKHASTL
jgi:hypothetical protein